MSHGSNLRSDSRGCIVGWISDISPLKGDQIKQAFPKQTVAPSIANGKKQSDFVVSRISSKRSTVKHWMTKKFTCENIWLILLSRQMIQILIGNMWNIHSTERVDSFLWIWNQILQTSLKHGVTNKTLFKLAFVCRIFPVNICKSFLWVQIFATSCKWGSTRRYTH